MGDWPVVQSPAVAAWYKAETAWHSGAPLAQAEQNLPERQRWLLRALAVLDQGDDEAIVELVGALSSQPGAGDIVAILSAVAPPTGRPPSSSKRSGKATSSVKDSGLPLKDLLKAYNQWRQGKSPRGSRRLQALAKQRPALALTLSVLGRRAAPLSPDSIKPSSVRIPALRLRLRNAQERRYPELMRWLQAPVGTWKWNWEATSELQWLASEPQHTQQAWLNALVRRLYDELRVGQILSWTEVALHLAKLSCRAGHHDFEQFLEDLYERIGRFDPGQGESAWLLLGLWEHLTKAPSAERLVLARHILDHVDLQVEVEPQQSREIALFLLAEGDSLELRERVLLDGPVLDHKAVSGAVAGMNSGLAKDWIVGLAALCREDWSVVGKMARTLLADAEWSVYGADLVHSMVCSGGEPPTPPKPACVRMIKAMTTNLVEAPLDEESLCMLFQDIRIHRHKLRRTFRVWQASIKKRLAEPADPTDARIGYELALALLLEDQEAVSARLRPLGRLLRSSRDVSWSNRHALGILARLLEIVLLDQARPLDSPEYRQVIDPLSRFLLRDGLQPVLAAAAELLVQRDLHCMGVAFWLALRIKELDQAGIALLSRLSAAETAVTPLRRMSQQNMGEMVSNILMLSDHAGDYERLGRSL